MAAPMLITMGNLGDADFESSTFHLRSANCLDLFGSESVVELLSWHVFWNAHEHGTSHHQINRITLWLYYYLSYLLIAESNKKEDTMK